jgi:DNA polymerase (family 10)
MRLEYLGICDHSKTAVYAGGLTLEELDQQWAEIDQLNVQMAPFKIFKGIESDILGDGSLDYPDEVLAKFDFVVASVHSVLKMDEERATNRLITAIENPYTTILGHPTGRLLLSRAGYPLDFKKVIDACAANNVVSRSMLIRFA